MCSKFIHFGNGGAASSTASSAAEAASVAGLSSDPVPLTMSWWGGKDHRDGSLAYYFSEPVVCNDAKGVGPLVLAYTEMSARK